MKKGMMKKIAAFVLAAAMIFTSVDLGWTMVSQAAGETTTITDAELIAQNYDALTAEEKAILTSGMVASESYSIAQPTDTAELVTIDSDNKVIYAKNFVDGEYTWVAESAKIMVGDEEKESVELSADPEDSSRTTGTFVFAENGYKVEVTYNLYIDVDADTQELYLNVPYYMADAMNNMNAIQSITWMMDTLVLNYSETLADNQYITEGSTMDRIVSGWVNEKNTYNSSYISYLLSAEGNGYDVAKSKVENILENGITYKNEAITVHEEVGYISEQPLIKVALGNRISLLTGLLEDLSPAVDSPWAILDIEAELAKNNESILIAGATDEQYTSFDALVAAAIGKSEQHYTTATENPEDSIVTLETSLFADSVTLSCNVNRYNVAVTVSADVVGADNEITTLTATKIADMASGTTAEEVNALIDSLEKEIVDEWNEQVVYIKGIEGSYDINVNNYTVTETAFEGTLEADLEYGIAYAPKNITIDYSKDDLTDETVPYGKVVTLGSASDVNSSYEHKINDVKYNQGDLYRVVEEDVADNVITVVTTSGAAKETTRLLDIVAEKYDLSSAAEAILTSKSIESEEYFIRMPNENCISYNEDGTKIIAENVSDGNYTWKPLMVDVNGTTIPFVGNEADISGVTISNAKVIYRLDGFSVSASEVDGILALPDQLKSEAETQLSHMKTITSEEYTEYFDLVGVMSVLNPDALFSTPEGKAAFLELLEEGRGTDASGNTKLWLQIYADEYAGLTDALKLDYYYDNNMSAKFREQVTLVSDNMLAIINDPGFKSFLSTNYETYYDKLYDENGEVLEDVQDKMDNLGSLFPAPSPEILVNGSGYLDLLNVLAGSADPNVSAKGETLYWEEAIGIAAPDMYRVTVTVKLTDGGTGIKNTGTVYVDVNKETGFTEALLAELKADAEALAKSWGLDDTHYTFSEGTYPAVGEMTQNVNVENVWVPNSYTVHFDGMTESETFYYGDNTIVLPVCPEAGYTYSFIIGGVEINASKYTFTTNELDTLFDANRTLTITVVKNDVAKGNIESLVTTLNEAAVSAGAADTISFVLFEDDETGEYSVVLRVNPFAANLQDALMDVAMKLASQSYIELGDKPFIDSGIYVATLVDTILYSGLSTDRLEAMIDANGDITEDTKDKVTGATVVTDAVPSEINTSSLGGFLFTTSFALSDVDGADVPLHVSLEDFDQGADTLKNVDAALAAFAPYGNVTLANGEATATIYHTGETEKAYEAMIAAMAIEGEVDINNFENPTMVEMVDYVSELIKEDVVTNKEVTADTIINTVSEISVDAAANVETYKDTITKVLDMVRTLLDGDLENAEITSNNESNTDADSYKCVASCPSTKLAQMANVPDTINLIGDVEVPVNVTFEPCNAVFEAFVVDPNAAEAYNMVDLTTDAAATIGGITGNAIVVLLDDVADTITTNNDVLFDLNGHTLAGLTANGTTLVVDSTLDTGASGLIGEINGGVKITAGYYGDKDVTSFLPDGYVQVNGKVSNKYFSVEETAEGVTINLDADFMNTDDPVALKTLAYDIATDLILNVYTFGGLSIDGNDVYKVALDDAIAYLNDVKADGAKATAKDMVATLVEELNCDGIETLANTIIADVTDFGAMQTAIEAGTPIAEYTVASYPWDVTVERTDADYLTVNLGTGAERTSTLTIVVTGEDDVKAKLADLCGELDSVFTEKTVAVELNDITYDPETDGVSVDAKGNVDITVDLTDKDYVAIVGIMLAYGNDDAELAGLVKSYLNNGVNKELVAAIEDASSADIISAVTAARNTSLQTMLDKFGIELTDTTIVDLADLYADALNIGAILIENLELTGGNRTLESFKEKGSFATYAVSKEGWHKMDINLTLILAEETAGYPDAVIGTPESKNAQIMQGFAVDEENGLIYIDVQCDGINWDIFKNAVDFNIENADATSITYETSTCDSGRVCTDDTITVTAYNPDQKLDPTVVTATYRIIVVGDTNKDGKTSVSDARLINRYEVDSEDAIAAMTDGPTRAADINKDNGISVSDTRKILRKYADYENYESSYK